MKCSSSSELTVNVNEKAAVSLNIAEGGSTEGSIDIDGETIFNNWAIGADFIADGPTFLFSMLT